MHSVLRFVRQKTPKHFYLGGKRQSGTITFYLSYGAKVRIKSEISPIFLGYILKLSENG